MKTSTGILRQFTEIYLADSGNIVMTLQGKNVFENMYHIYNKQNVSDFP